MVVITDWENWQVNGTSPIGRLGWTVTESGTNTIDAAITPNTNWIAPGLVLEVVAANAGGTAYVTNSITGTDIFYFVMRLMVTQIGYTTASDLVYTHLFYTAGFTNILMGGAYFNSSGTQIYLMGFDNDGDAAINWTATHIPVLNDVDTVEQYWNSNSTTDEYEGWVDNISEVSGSLTGSAAGWSVENLTLGCITSPTLASQTTYQIADIACGDEQRLYHTPAAGKIEASSLHAGGRFGVHRSGVLQGGLDLETQARIERLAREAADLDKIENDLARPQRGRGVQYRMIRKDRVFVPADYDQLVKRAA